MVSLQVYDIMRVILLVLDHVFRTLDLDGNGELDFKEYVLAMDLVHAKTPEEKLKWAFKM